MDHDISRMVPVDYFWKQKAEELQQAWSIEHDERIRLEERLKSAKHTIKNLQEVISSYQDEEENGRE